MRWLFGKRTNDPKSIYERGRYNSFGTLTKLLYWDIKMSSKGRKQNESMRVLDLGL